MEHILRTYEYEQYGLTTKQIKGLNLFSANGFKVPSSQDPRLIFLQEITKNAPSSCLIGGVGLRDLIDEPQEAENYISDTYHVQCRAGLYEGNFYAADLDDLNCFFPNLSAAFWHFDGANTDDSQYLVECGAIALYSGIVAGKGMVLQQLMVEPPRSLFDPLHPSQHEWMQLTSACCSIIAVANHDGRNIEISARDKSALSDIDKFLDISARAVEASSWYQQNAFGLEWDVNEQCLMLHSK